MGPFPKSQPLFLSLAQQLRKRIDSGEWAIGDRLPTERELADTYSVGINTVRRAVGSVAKDGTVTPRQGSGIYVSAQKNRRARTTIGIIVPSTDYYFPPMVEGIAQVIEAAEARARVASSEYDDVLETRRIRELIATGIAGLLIAPTLHMTDPTSRLDLLRTLPLPVVLMERQPPRAAPDDTLSYVCTDVIAGGYSAVRHLVERGCRRIGFLGRSDTATADAVWQGYEKALHDLRLIRIDTAVVRRQRWTARALADYAAVARREQLDGLFCLGDREATALLPGLAEVGLSVPRDLAVVTYDDEEADSARVSLSAVSPPKREIGRIAAITLLRQLAHGDDVGAVKTVLRPVLRVRDSSSAIDCRKFTAVIP